MTQSDQQDLYNNTVVPLILETGFAVTLNHPNKGVYDPDVGYTQGVPVESYGYAIEDDSAIESVPTSIAEKVTKAILAVEINEPIPNEDTITFKGKSYQVLGIEPLEPGNVLFFYTMFLGA